MRQMANNRIVRLLILFLAALLATAQVLQPVPAFSSENIRPYGRATKILSPGMVLELWGRNLAPVPWCGQEQKPQAPLPRELCGVQVLIGSRPAELMYVSGNQINLKIPEDVPAEGFEPIQVCVGNVCSATLSMLFSTHTALLTLDEPAYVHMPVWIDVDPPSPYVVSYPCGFWPWNFPGYEFEVLRKGQPLAPLPQPPRPFIGTAPLDRCEGPTYRGRLPLHLLYRFEEPGTYSVRFTAKKSGKTLYQSDWTDIQIEPFSEEKRGAQLHSLEGEARNGPSAYYVVPSLLVWPDEKALAVLLKLIHEHTSACMNYDCVRLGFGRAALAGFDDTLLRREIPQDRLLQLCPPNGNCK